MPLQKMITFNFLRILILVHFIVAGFAIFNGYQYLSWSGVDANEITRSPDAAYGIKNLLTNWWYLKGISCGFLIFLLMTGIHLRKYIIHGGWKLSMHYLLLILPAICVSWYGRNIL